MTKSSSSEGAARLITFPPSNGSEVGRWVLDHFGIPFKEEPHTSPFFFFKGVRVEAIRFNPHNPILLRYCHQDTVLGAAGGRQRKIKAGKQVYAVTLSAMFDKAGFQTPGRFRVDRRDPRNLQFGYGLHACFGKYINDIQIPEILNALLRLKNLRRSSGSDGKIQFDGSFPDRLILEFEGQQKNLGG